MGVLRKKDERTETITVRIPSSVKAELDQLRERADAGGIRSKRDDVRINDPVDKASTRGTRRRRSATQGQRGRGSGAREWFDASGQRAFSRGQRQRR